MTPKEQLDWLTDFGSWTNDKLPVLCALGNAWESAHIKSMEEGLKLISAFSYCRDFVHKSLLFRDFSRRVDRLRFYVEKIKKEVAAGSAVVVPGGDTLAYAPQVPTRRRGRPTKEESAKMARERAESEQQSAKQEAVAKLVGSVTKQPENATPQPKEQTLPKQGDLFSAPAAPAPASNFATAVALTQGEAKLHLDQLAWLMSKDLQMRIKEVAGLRAVAAKEAEQAKALADNNVPAAIIEPHTRAAVEAKDNYLAIYAAVDKELGELYSLLYIGGEHIPAWEKRCADKGISIEQLKSLLLPYWEKAGKPTVQLESVTASPEPEESEEEKKVRQARCHAIRTYFMRKDSKLTSKRIERMRELIEEVKGYGLPTEEYEAVLAASEKEYEEMMKEE